ncbi:TPA: hypothetical protein DCX15_04465 [bacterium]|nr:hypothetical protein [bacterium]
MSQEKQKDQPVGQPTIKQSSTKEMISFLAKTKSVDFFGGGQQTSTAPDTVREVKVGLQRPLIPLTEDLALWVVIRNSTGNIGSESYMKFINDVMCGEPSAKDQREVNEKRNESKLPFLGVDSYDLLRVATEVFLMTKCGVKVEKWGSLITGEIAQDTARRLGRDEATINEGIIKNWWNGYITMVNGSGTLPHLALIMAKLSDISIKIDVSTEEERDKVAKCYGILEEKLTRPCFLELIWSYWHEEGMLVQTMNAISLRFQNKRGPAGRDPLAHLEIDPLRPLNNMLWGYIQDEQHRLTVVRRAYEYDHHYGLTLYGKALPKMQPAESRSKFLESFHNLLHLCSIFFKEDDDTTVIADGFPLLNGLKEVHLLLTQGQHNQYGDLPWTARREMLMQQWLLARPEMREFLPSRIMVAYPEPWMDRVDAMKRLQGWTDTPVIHFRNLGVFGEQILLSIRFGAWIEVFKPDQAANWARYWRAEIQGYIHAYRAVTGVDLTSEPVDHTLPSVHLRNRFAIQRQSRQSR